MQIQYVRVFLLKDYISRMYQNLVFL